MSIESEITRLQTAKESIKTAIEDKGVTIPSGILLSDFSTFISEIKTNNGLLTDTFVPTTSGTTTIDLTQYGYTSEGCPKIRFLYEKGDMKTTTHTCRRTLAIFDISNGSEKTTNGYSYLHFCAYADSGSNYTRFSKESVANMWSDGAVVSGSYSYSAIGGTITNDKATLTIFSFDPTTDNTYGCIIGRQYVWGVIL